MIYYATLDIESDKGFILFFLGIVASLKKKMETQIMVLFNIINLSDTFFLNRKNSILFIDQESLLSIIKKHEVINVLNNNHDN